MAKPQTQSAALASFYASSTLANLRRAVASMGAACRADQIVALTGKLSEAHGYVEIDAIAYRLAVLYQHSAKATLKGAGGDSELAAVCMTEAPPSIARTVRRAVEARPAEVIKTGT